AQRAILLDHYRAMLGQYGTDAGLRLARKHVSWYSRGLPGSAEFRAEMNRMGDADAVISRIEMFYDRLIDAGIHRGAPMREPAPSEQTLAEAA
ncbi:MAG: tRNA-dihydrouridine synthase, partial [Acetobacteraceae bacterium]